jgi:alkaline phosphatase
MTSKALELLDGSDKGFFLQVEGASIDKQDHAANACAQIGETVAFDDATTRRATRTT